MSTRRSSSFPLLFLLIMPVLVAMRSCEQVNKPVEAARAVPQVTTPAPKIVKPKGFDI